MNNSFSSLFNWKTSLLLLGSVFAIAPPAAAMRLNLNMTNSAAMGGMEFASPWVGFHRGDFDLFNVGDPVQPSIEEFLVNGDQAPLNEQFRQEVESADTFPPPGEPPTPTVIPPQEQMSRIIEVPEEEAVDLFLSYIAPVVEMEGDQVRRTRRAIANADERAIRVFDENGEFTPIELVVSGQDIIEINGDDRVALPFPDLDEPVLSFQVTQEADEDPATVPEPSLLLGIGAVAGTLGLTSLKKKSKKDTAQS